MLNSQMQDMTSFFILNMPNSSQKKSLESPTYSSVQPSPNYGQENFYSLLHQTLKIYQRFSIFFFHFYKQGVNH